MNPQDVFIPSVLEGSLEDMNERSNQILQCLNDLYPYIVELATIFQGSQYQEDLDAFLALDAKRMELCDVYFAQLTLIRQLGE